MKSYYCLIIGFVLSVIYLIPFLILGEDSYVLIWDFLDSSVAHYRSMIDIGALFDNEMQMPVLCGVNRGLGFPAPFNINVLLYALMPSFWAIVANTFLIKFTAFVGMFSFMKSHILCGNNRLVFAFVTATLFMMVPFHIDYGISSAGIPMLFFAFFNLHKGVSKGLCYLLILYYGLYSSLVLSGAFALVVLSIWLLFLWISEKKLPLYPFYGLIGLVFVYMCTNWQMICGFVSPNGVVSHRYEFHKAGVKESVSRAVNILKHSQSHAGIFPAGFIVGLFVVVWTFFAEKNGKLNFLMLSWGAISAVILMTSVLHIVFPNVNLFQQFQFDRFYFLYPAICFVLFGISLSYFNGWRGIVMGTGIFLLLSFWSFRNDTTFRNNIRILAGRDIKQPSFRQFYDIRLFDELKKDLRVEEFRDKVACVGFYPSVAEYNHFFTIDSYLTMYPLEYKHSFQRIIQGELDKSEELKHYFCDWGSRCYLFSSELDFRRVYGKNEDKSITLSIDNAALNDAGCKYIFSAVSIENYNDIGLEYVESYSHPESYWNIRVYRII